MQKSLCNIKIMNKQRVGHFVVGHTMRCTDKMSTDKILVDKMQVKMQGGGGQNAGHFMGQGGQNANIIKTLYI